MILSLDNITLKLAIESKGLRLKYDNESFLLSNQTIKETKEIIELNYQTVKNHFQHKISDIISIEDLQKLSLKIVMYYFYMYNAWREMYLKEKNRNLTFIERDFDNITTSYLIVDYFKKSYPDNYELKSRTLLGMTSIEFKEFEHTKDLFDNR